LCSAWSKTRVGLDHCPIVLDSGDKKDKAPSYFYFEKQWTLKDGLDEMVSDKWCSNRAKVETHRYSLDVWHGCISLLRQFLRGWSINKRREDRISKKELCQRLSELDKGVEEHGDDLLLW
jgi:hypothetical protein